MSLVRRVRGRPFKPGNPGRPRGAKNKLTEFLEQIGEEQAPEILKKVAQQALAGDRTSQRMVLDRYCQPRKGRPVNVVMPPIETPEDLFAAIASIWTAICDGRLTPDEASALSVVVDRSIQAIQLHAIERRIKTLEEAQGRNEQDDHPSA